MQVSFSHGKWKAAAKPPMLPNMRRLFDSLTIAEKLDVWKMKSQVSLSWKL